VSIAGLKQACTVAKNLGEILDLEFEALKNQDLTKFESLQEKKEPILNLLSSLDIPPVNNDDKDDPWNPLRDIVSKCRDSHRRNEILINRKLESIRMALNTMSGGDPNSSLEMYDKLGKISQKSNRKNFLEV
jgi:flagellar biosynthesis/type III secretory pathway chaperone